MQHSKELVKMSDRNTGEIPLLFIYELDPLNDCVEDTVDTAKKSSIPASTSDDPIKDTIVKQSFLALCQRRVELSHNPMLHPFSQRVFGTPFVLRISDLEGCTGRELYDIVAKRVERFVPEPVLRILKKNKNVTKESDRPESYANRQKLRGDRKQGFNQTNSDSAETAFGPIPRYGFRLRVTSRNGHRCELCSWYDSCSGCLITDDDYPTIAMDGDTVAIDWHISVDIASSCFDELSSSIEPRANMLANVKKHATCQARRGKGGRGNITLEDCLHAFSEEEDMDDVSFSFLKTRTP